MEHNQATAEEYANDIIDNWDYYKTDYKWEELMSNAKRERGDWIEFRDIMFNRLFKELKDNPKYDDAREMFLQQFVMSSNLFFIHAVRTEEEHERVHQDLLVFLNNVGDDEFMKYTSHTYYLESLERSMYYLGFCLYVEFKNDPKYDNARKRFETLFPSVSNKIITASETWMSYGFTVEGMKKKFIYSPLPLLAEKEEIEQKINDMISIGCTIKEIKVMLCSCPQIFSFSKEMLQEQKSFYDEIGLTKILIDNNTYSCQNVKFLKEKYIIKV